MGDAHRAQHARQVAAVEPEARDDHVIAQDERLRVTSCGEPGRRRHLAQAAQPISTRSAQRGAELTNHGASSIENTAPARKLWFHGAAIEQAGAAGLGEHERELADVRQPQARRERDPPGVAHEARHGRGGDQLPQHHADGARTATSSGCRSRVQGVSSMPIEMKNTDSIRSRNGRMSAWICERCCDSRKHEAGEERPERDRQTGLLRQPRRSRDDQEHRAEERLARASGRGARDEPRHQPPRGEEPEHDHADRPQPAQDEFERAAGHAAVARRRGAGGGVGEAAPSPPPTSPAPARAAPSARRPGPAPAARR